MKRVLTSILAVVMIFSVFSCLTVGASAIEDNERYQIKTTGFKNGEITFDIQLAPNQTLTEAMVSIKFDKNAMTVKAAGPAMKTDSSGSKVEAIPGLHASGISYYDDTCFTFAYTTSAEGGYKIGSTAKSIFTITFKANNVGAATNFDFYAGDCYSTKLIQSFKNVSTLNVPEIASTTSGTNSVSFAWNAVTGAKQYKIYKQGAQGLAVIATVGADVTTYEDKNVTPGQTYTYAVSAVDSSNGETSYNTFKVSCKVLQLAAPVVTAKITEQGVKINWSSVSGAAEYKVYRKTYDASTKKWSSGWKRIKTLTGTEYIDGSVKIGTKYKYLVKAVNGNATKNSDSTSELNFKISPKPKATLKATSIQIKWTPVVSAESYRIYRAEYNKSKGKYDSYKKVDTVSGSTKEWTDSNVTSGKKYKYCLKTVKGKVVCDKAQSNYMYFVTKTTAKTDKAKTGVKISWTSVQGATSFKIYRSELKNGAWTKFGHIGTVNSKSKSFVDETVVSGVQYRYKVKAFVNKIGQTSDATAERLYLQAPKTTAAVVADGINVSWTESVGATNYVVYRATYDSSKKKWSGYKKMKTTDATTTTYKDTTAKSGVKYRYCVKAKNGSTVSAYIKSSTVKR